MSKTPQDSIKDGIDALVKALEVDLFGPRSSGDPAKDAAEKSKVALYKATLKMLGWQESEYGNSFYRKNADGVSEKIYLPPIGGFLKMESLDATLRQVTFEMEKLTLWPKIDLEDSE